MPTSDTLPIASLDETRPRSPEVHLLRTESGDHAFFVDGSRLFDLDKAAFAQLSAALDSEAIGSVLDDLGLAAPSPYIDDVALTRIPVRASIWHFSAASRWSTATYCGARRNMPATAPPRGARGSAFRSRPTVRC